jgi:1-acyl-sn-glycerol-3-phosphate acyltransferase
VTDLPGETEARGDDPAARSDLTPILTGAALTARTVIRSLTRVTVEGALEAIPRDGPLIIASNHLSNADGPLIAGWLTPALGRRIHWLAKREMFDIPFAGWFLRASSVHPVDRGAADVEAFRLAIRILEAGNVLLVFPEGTRSPAGGLQRPRDGLALLALRTGAAILPVGVAGTDRLWPRGRIPHPGGRVALRVGRAFTLAEVLGDAIGDRRRAKPLATEAIMIRIAALLPPRHRGVYGQAPAPPPPEAIHDAVVPEEGSDAANEAAVDASPERSEGDS